MPYPESHSFLLDQPFSPPMISHHYAPVQLQLRMSSSDALNFPSRCKVPGPAVWPAWRRSCGCILPHVALCSSLLCRIYQVARMTSLHMVRRLIVILTASRWAICAAAQLLTRRPPLPPLRYHLCLPWPLQQL